MSIDSRTAHVERLLAMCEEAIGMERLERARANLNAERGRLRTGLQTFDSNASNKRANRMPVTLD